MRLQLTHPAWSTSVSPDGLRVHRRTGVGSGWAQVDQHQDHVVLKQDEVRSFPLFYAFDPQSTEVIVSDDVRFVVDAVGARGLDADSAREFRHLGYVTGAQTLHPGIRQVQAGEQATVRDGGDARSAFGYRWSDADHSIDDAVAADVSFTKALDVSFERLVNAAAGRQLVLPLSGGLDSRLIGIILRDLGYSNVLTFTYGSGITAESEVSRSVATDLGLSWEYVQYDVDTMRVAWRAAETAGFLTDSYAGASLPHIQDWYAIRQLKTLDVVAPDAIFLAGHTIVGNMHDEAVLDDDAPIAASRIRDLIINHHAVLQHNSARTLSQDDAFLAKLDAHLELVGYDGSAAARLRAIEMWNLWERQTKYINNSMRGYEHFGFEWALPMLDAPVVDAWEGLSPRLRRNRNWYAQYVSRRYEESTGTVLSTWQPSSMPSSFRNQLTAALRTTGLLRLANRVASARVYRNHPMGFDAFLEREDADRISRTLLRGGNPFGLFADKFLADDWNPHARLFH